MIAVLKPSSPNFPFTKEKLVMPIQVNQDSHNSHHRKGSIFPNFTTSGLDLINPNPIITNDPKTLRIQGKMSIFHMLIYLQSLSLKTLTGFGLQLDHHQYKEKPCRPPFIKRKFLDYHQSFLISLINQPG